jgi:hypothetical protein
MAWKDTPAATRVFFWVVIFVGGTLLVLTFIALYVGGHLFPI